MSQTLSAPPRPPAATPMRPGRPPQTYDTWKAKAFTALGWKSATENQKADRLETSLRGVEIYQTAVKPLPAAEAAAVREGAGDRFNNFLKCRTQFEQLKKRDSSLGGDLKQAANTYIKQFDGHGQTYQSDPTNILRRNLCVSTLHELQQLELAEQVVRLPEPPWGGKEAGNAAKLKVKLDLASLPPGEQTAEPFNNGNASPTFWINKMGSPTDGKPNKTFIFKPATKAPSNGFPDYGEPAREAMAGKMANFMNETLGMKLPVPNTQVISLSKEDLSPETLQMLIIEKKIDKTDAYVGSVQQFETTDGSFAEKCGASDRAELDPQSVHEMAVFDLITLNADRHEGNFLVRKTKGSPDQLIPIDHGNCFPTKLALHHGGNKMGTEASALMSVPAAHEPFSQAMRVKIAAIDPTALEGMLRRERAAVENENRGIGDAVSENAIALSKRSAMFLKLAAPMLSPAAIQFAMKQNMDDLFDLDDEQGFPQAAARVIQSVQADQHLLKQWFLMPAGMQKIVLAETKKDGWNGIDKNIALTLKLWKSPVPFFEPVPPPVSDAALTPEDESKYAELKEQFPGTIFPSSPVPVRKLLGLFAEWDRLKGTPGKVAEYLELIGEDPDPSVSLNLEKAIKAVQALSAIRVAVAAPPADEKLAEIKLSLDYYKTIIPALPETDRADASQALASAEAKIAPGAVLTNAEKDTLHQSVETMRIKSADIARYNLLSIVKTMEDGFEKGAAKTLDGSKLRSLRKWIQECGLYALQFQFADALEAIGTTQALLATN